MKTEVNAEEKQKLHIVVDPDDRKALFAFLDFVTEKGATFQMNAPVKEGDFVIRIKS